MKASQLMIGDRVKLTRSGYTFKWKACDYNLYCDTEIEPIPITKKILELNGWREADCYHDMVYYLPENKCLITGSIKALELLKTPMVHPRGSYDYSIHLAEIRTQSHTPLQLEYVHQFQHALRLLGFDDLADNFKV